MRQLVWEKENSEFKTVKLRLKIDLVSYPTLAEGLVNIVTIFLIISAAVQALSSVGRLVDHSLYI